MSSFSFFVLVGLFLNNGINFLCNPSQIWCPVGQV